MYHLQYGINAHQHSWPHARCCASDGVRAESKEEVGSKLRQQPVSNAAGMASACHLAGCKAAGAAETVSAPPAAGAAAARATDCAAASLAACAVLLGLCTVLLGQLAACCASGFARLASAGESSLLALRLLPSPGVGAAALLPIFCLKLSPCELAAFFADGTTAGWPAAGVGFAFWVDAAAGLSAVGCAAGLGCNSGTPSKSASRGVAASAAWLRGCETGPEAAWGLRGEASCAVLLAGSSASFAVLLSSFAGAAAAACCCLLAAGCTGSCALCFDAAAVRFLAGAAPDAAVGASALLLAGEASVWCSVSCAGMLKGDKGGLSGGPTSSCCGAVAAAACSSCSVADAFGCGKFVIADCFDRLDRVLAVCMGAVAVA